MIMSKTIAIMGSETVMTTMILENFLSCCHFTNEVFLEFRNELHYGIKKLRTSTFLK